MKTTKSVAKAVAALDKEPKQEVGEVEEAPKKKTLYFRKEHGDGHK